MSSYEFLQFSPSKSGLGSVSGPPQRKVQPSPEKQRLPYTTVILPRQRVNTTTESGSPVRKGKAGNGEPVLDLAKSVIASKRIELSYPLVENGRPTTPPSGDFSELLNLFPTTFAAEIMPPYVIIRVRILPPKPWPFTVGGLPLWLTTDEFASCFDRGRTGKGRKALEHIDLHRKEEFSEDILKQAIVVFQTLPVKIQDIIWCAEFWRITISDDTDLNVLPRTIARQICFYKFSSEEPDLDPSALRSKIPQGVEYDDALYATTPNALLRPGIMVSSSMYSVTKDGKTEETFKTTTSGILVADQHGQLFITVATHGFEDDGLVYHPDPVNGLVIGKIVDRLPGADISIVKLNTGLQYVNETFGTKDNPDGIKTSGLSPCYPPHLRIYDPIVMENPFSGLCEGCILGIGAKIPGEGGKDYILHEWYIFENGSEPADGSYGSPILDSDGNLVGLFRFVTKTSLHCLGVSAMELRAFGYEVCSRKLQF